MHGVVHLEVYWGVDRRCGMFAQSGLIIKHEDRWNNSGFRFPGFLKKPNGVFTSSIFKLIGWGRQVDKAAGAAK